jgi:hypothetical protein
VSQACVSCVSSPAFDLAMLSARSAGGGRMYACRRWQDVRVSAVAGCTRVGRLEASDQRHHHEPCEISVMSQVASKHLVVELHRRGSVD